MNYEFLHIYGIKTEKWFGPPHFSSLILCCNSNISKQKQNFNLRNCVKKIHRQGSEEATILKMTWVIWTQKPRRKIAKNVVVFKKKKEKKK